MYRITAIREHSKVGRGSCTSIDETWDDKEIISLLDDNNINTADEAVQWALEQEGLFLEQGLNQRWGEDEDPQLTVWQEWNKEDS